MNIVITVIAFVLVFSVLVLIHELGHFVMAKRAGIKVEEFGFGLPPRIWGKKKGETIYSINWIPFGGFVRMLGEDSSDPKMAKKKRSFAAAPMRARIKVVVAGVVMNFFLAWLLLTIGFTAGMQPLLGPDDVLPAVSEGMIEIVEGAKIQEVVEGSFADQVGFEAGDVLVSVDGQPVSAEGFGSLSIKPFVEYKVNREGEVFSFEPLEENFGEVQELGLVFSDFAPFPRVKVFDVAETSELYQAGIRDGDYIVAVNDQQVYTVEEFEKLIRGEQVVEYLVYRDGLREKFLVQAGDERRVVISRLVPGEVAAEVGLQPADVIVSVNGKRFYDSLDLIEFVKGNADQTLGFMVERNGEEIFYELQPSEEGVIGVFLSELISYSGKQHFSLYNVDLLSSVVEIKDQQYPLLEAGYQAVTESFRMSKLTAEMFVGVVVNLVTGGGVPDNVAGPVGIAQMTHTFLQEGLISLLRFVAILSLSLAVINILPFPALDGGRLLFILVELLLGRKVDQKLESTIHALGYILILLLIVLVTYNDIVRLF